MSATPGTIDPPGPRGRRRRYRLRAGERYRRGGGAAAAGERRAEAGTECGAEARVQQLRGERCARGDEVPVVDAVGLAELAAAGGVVDASGVRELELWRKVYGAEWLRFVVN